MRATRETELARDFPIHVVTGWLGNTPRIALKHYLQTTDADFERAAQSGAESGAQAVQNPVQHPAAASGTESQSKAITLDEAEGYAVLCETVRDAAKLKSGEDGTAIELFIAGVRGWDTELGEFSTIRRRGK